MQVANLPEFVLPSRLALKFIARSRIACWLSDGCKPLAKRVLDVISVMREITQHQVISLGCFRVHVSCETWLRPAHPSHIFFQYKTECFVKDNDINQCKVLTCVHLHLPILS